MSTTTVTIHGVPLEVQFAYEPFHRGERGTYGEPLTPDEQEEVSVEEVFLGGYEIMCLMTDDAIGKARDAVIKARREGCY